MSLKKYLKRESAERRAGQVTIEYFIILVVVVTLTIVGRSALFTQFRASMDDFNGRSLVKMQYAAGDTDFEAPGLDPTVVAWQHYRDINYRTPQNLLAEGGDAFWGEDSEPGAGSTPPGGGDCGRPMCD